MSELRRQHLRFVPVGCALVRFVVKPHLGARTGVIADLSTHGVGILTSVSLKPDDILVLQLGAISVPWSSNHRALVKDAQRLDVNAWRIGCQLDQPLTPEEVAALVEEETWGY